MRLSAKHFMYMTLFNLYNSFDPLPPQSVDKVTEASERAKEVPSTQSVNHKTKI